ncbi:GntR family transcriptional regulator [Ihubacter massiliensis]|uniref:GntR family transcriptional regulator n=1 Tax=Hominibacterium faecale TaxID=2839743 RepID=A0A9J6QSX9_9FIRM|nr:MULTISPECIES: GntR family transcriptional regulator [Eubacteriales Family XIII. Incertae Sedis]MCI7301730.1 GntR family transcriptional regulator [Clostridia bacterium]MDE8734418.1 GntR family transcriptional regulator [Eubacteriales bacterium DFI.9.88]MDY3010080.1 GntR family transcriptional regulator [Clostridiales Family XIII bacterium]MCO7121631.1 GntR family transcriptional regulator [Ihubacter massiliensis]MCU7378612.1 GntR family transcriptional regulator [Hominibacterium faecale]
MKFTKISAPSMKELFVRQLTEAILSGELTVGEKLPAERELAQQMQVSRAVVNSGINELARCGFVEVRPRQGTFVADFRRYGNMDTLIAIMEYNGGQLAEKQARDLLQVRKEMEHLACELAIDCASEEELGKLGTIIGEMKRARTSRQAAELAFQFQHELTYAGGNSMLLLIYYSFKGPAMALWEWFCKRHGMEELCHNYASLYEYVRMRDKRAVHQWIDYYLDGLIKECENP